MKQFSIDFYDEYVRGLESQGYKRTHTSLAMGYTRVNYFGVDEYCGKFGKGKRVYGNNPMSSRFHFVTYFIKDGV